LRIEAVDESGKVVGRDRDLAALREQVGEKVERVVQQESAASGWGRDGLTDWDCGAIPERVTIDAGEAWTARYPALVDQGEAAGLRLFETPEKAALHMRRGVRRLLSIRMGSELAFLEQELGGFDRLGLWYVPLGDRRVIARDLCDAAIDEAMLEGRALPRDGEAFDRLLNEAAAHVEPAAKRVFGIAESALADHAKVRAAIEAAPAAWGGAAGDLAAQLDAMLAPGFLAETPAFWRRQLPRYLKAARRRIEKLGDGQIKRDAEAMRVVEPYWRAGVQHEATGFDVVFPEARRFRWMIEEYRVSMFAQDLGTAVKVSPKRLDDQARKAGIRV
jgi:ATP-dependent helicase HrpA